LAKAGSAPKTKLESKPVGGVHSKPETKDAPQVAAEVGPEPQAKALPKSEIKVEPNSEAQATAAGDVPPQLVKRVHELYEKLGREEVRLVEDWERTKTVKEPAAK
jgi:H+-transporting ATPase